MYVVGGALEGLTRDGYDFTRHDLSLLSNGPWGWIHIALLVTTGLLTVAGAVGMQRALRSGPGSTWGPALVGLYGLGLIGAGVFPADPALGFPPGTPEDARAVSWRGLLHFLSGGVGFLGLIAACFVFARRFSALGRPGWATFSRVTGVLYLGAFFGIAAGSKSRRGRADRHYPRLHGRGGARLGVGLGGVGAADDRAHRAHRGARPCVEGHTWHTGHLAHRQPFRAHLAHRTP